MKTNLKTCPDSPWKSAFEIELRSIIANQDVMLKKVPKPLRSKTHSIEIEEIFG